MMSVFLSRYYQLHSMSTWVGGLQGWRRKLSENCIFFLISMLFHDTGIICRLYILYLTHYRVDLLCVCFHTIGILVFCSKAEFHYDLCISCPEYSDGELELRDVIQVKGLFTGFTETTCRFIDWNKSLSIECFNVSQARALLSVSIIYCDVTLCEYSWVVVFTEREKKKCRRDSY